MAHEHWDPTHAKAGLRPTKHASQLEKVVASKPFDLPRVDGSMTQTGRDVSTAELYVLRR